jgi:FkbH-like protein
MNQIWRLSARRFFPAALGEYLPNFVTLNEVTVTEALKILQSAPKEASADFEVLLACGFTPLHLQTFLAAHLQKHLTGRRVKISTGLYGDLAGTIESLAHRPAQGVAIVLEWPDLDPRLGYRTSGSWGQDALGDILPGARAMLERIGVAIDRIPAGTKIAMCAPTLPLPPLFHTAGWQAGEVELLLEQAVAEFCATIGRHAGVRVVNSRRLAEDSAPSQRFDLKSDLLAGLPYTVPHADAVGGSLARLLAPRTPKKGLITDLDETLWSGIVGEVGSDGVSWDLASHQALHGLYQRLLASLSGQGVLIGIASRNDPAVVERALQREDILLKPEQVFPVEAHWNAKSGSVERILRSWNVAADSVVFVDDSPMELAEVAAAHPGIECILFPKGDYAASHAMFRRIRDLFGKDRLSDEDALRLASIRQGAAFRQPAEDGAASESFLQQMKAVLSFDFGLSRTDPRVLELVNKTNQFNLNGIRYTGADWASELAQAGAFLSVISYEDKFGPLGRSP